ncbi:hypothetical protein ACFS5M_14135 [Lacinutrix iliipiscaria]|uniref:Uncharacterized protein n=1 Tax=Lacinutrix iliipiscaria TaxID=1230532 RepID=A0ABW5WPW1_9FLAO
MAYNNFSVQEVFKNKLLNVVCNNILEQLTLKYETEVPTSFCLTGTVAKIINGASATPVKVVPFITDDLKKFNFFGNEIAKYLGASAVKFSDRIQMTYKGIFLECWLTDDLGTINTVDTIQVQDSSDVPLNIN